MSTLDGIIIRIMRDGKRRTIKDIGQTIVDGSTLYEGETPKGTLHYHIAKLCERNELRAIYSDTGNRVVYEKM